MIRQTVKRVFASRTGWRSSAPIRKAGSYVLTYHRVGTPAHRFPHMDAGVFRAHMEWVRDNCDPIAPPDFRRATLRPSRARPPVLVTFDDAYTDFFECAYPVLERLQIPAVCFVPTDFVDRRLPFWWDVLHSAVEACTLDEVRVPWTPGAPPLAMSGGGSQALLRAAKTQIKQLPDEAQEPTVAQLVAALGVDRDRLAVDASTMTWDQIRSTTGLVTYGGHTHTHAIMPVLSAEQLRLEIDTCRDRLAAETGTAPSLFAYPSGAFNEQVKAAVRAAGFDLGFSTLEGVNGAATDWMEIRRVHGPASADELPWLLSGIRLEMSQTRGSGPA